MKHKNNYRIYEIDQDLINFLRGDGLYLNRDKSLIDKQVYSHFDKANIRSDKYIGIIIEFQQQLFFAPLTHDGDKNWSSRHDSCDFEFIYNESNEYIGSLLICKALPLTNNLVKALSYREISEKEGWRYSKLCEKEVNYLNSVNIHDKIQTKMIHCIYDYESDYKNFRINYSLAAKNVKEYNELKQQEQLLTKNKPKDSSNN